MDNVVSDTIKSADNSFSANIEDFVANGTRAHLEGLRVKFDNGDEIAVFDNNTAVSVYTYSSEDGKFSGTSSNEGDAMQAVLALYPSSAVKGYNSGIQGTLPAVQDYVENNISVNSHIMYAQATSLDSDEPLVFKNMTSYIKLQLYANTDIVVKNIEFSTPDNTTIVSGDFQIIKDSNGNDILDMCEYGATNHPNQSNKVTLDCSGGSTDDNAGIELSKNSNSPTIFYISLPPQEYPNGFTVKVTDIFGREFTKSAFSNGGLTLERRHIKPMEALEVSFDNSLLIEKGTDGKYYAKIESGADNYKQLLKWAFIVNNYNRSLGLILDADVYIPSKVIVENRGEMTYELTETKITLENDVPSGSNWVPLRPMVNYESDAYKGIIEGNNYTISNLYVAQTQNYAGFIGAMYDGGIVKNLKFSNVIIKGGNYVGVIGRGQNGTLVENVHVLSSHIIGNENIGGIVGKNYRRTFNTSGVRENMSYIINCSIDGNSSVTGTGYSVTTGVGGICGTNEASAVIGCKNNADVTGVTYVGGIVGLNRSYNSNQSNGYLLASISGSDATITATKTEGSASGIVGELFRNTDHTNSYAYVVACCSYSTVNASKPGSLIAYAYKGHHGTIISSFALKAGDALVGEDGSYIINDGGVIQSDHYTNFSEITSEIIGLMNDEIDNYNANVADYEGPEVAKTIKCHYKWQYNSSGWPTLVENPASDN